MDTKHTPTAEEVLNKYSTDTTTKGRVRFEDAIKAMEEYSSLKSAELIEDNKRLREKLYALKLMMKQKY